MNWFGLLGVTINASDGELWTHEMISINVTPVNDPPVFSPPAEWAVEVMIDQTFTLDISGYISDIEGDQMTVSVEPSDHVTVSGKALLLLYGTGFTENNETLTISVSDNNDTVSKELLVMIKGEGGGDDDDDDQEDYDLTIKAGTDSWTAVVEAEEGYTVYLVVEDDQGNRSSYLMNYSDGRYSAEIQRDEGGSGFAVWVSFEEDGEPISENLTSTLPALKEELDDEFPVWFVVIPALLILLAIMIVVIAMVRGSKREDHEE
jgi:hypothetical protein